MRHPLHRGAVQRQKQLTYGIMITVLAVSVLVSRVPFKSLTKGLKPVYFVVAFTAVMNMFFTAGTPVADVWLLRASPGRVL